LHLAVTRRCGESDHRTDFDFACEVLMTNQVNGDNGPNVEGKGLHEAGEGLWLPLGNFHDDYDSD
jgi:hypothetical protein